MLNSLPDGTPDAKNQCTRTTADGLVFSVSENLSAAGVYGVGGTSNYMCAHSTLEGFSYALATTGTPVTLNKNTAGAYVRCVRDVVKP